MPSMLRPPIAVLYGLLMLPSAGCAQLLYDVESKPVVIWSEGTRMAGTLWRPEKAGDEPLPGLLLIHGWGGLRDHLDATYAPKFADAGFAVLTFDYRGWGDSDGKLVAEEPLPENSRVPGSNVTVAARVIREVVDPYDQIEDVRSAFAWLLAEHGVDKERIGIWGTSYGGGHVVMLGASEPRVKAIVAQVGSQGGEESEEFRAHAHRRAAEKARGEIDPIPQGIDAVPGLSGTPDVAKMVRYRPILFADRVNVPTLFIDMEDEELFDRTKNGLAAHEIVKANTASRYVTHPGQHYDVYTRHYIAASDEALAWFVQHLKGKREPKVDDATLPTSD
ncbi:MAG: alpha/beta fold hydrolase [Deltaproteobacteria bacterium]|nr:alpha/beta fold hydrolase [Deltaproteobacteria bacterium]